MTPRLRLLTLIPLAALLICAAASRAAAAAAAATTAPLKAAVFPFVFHDSSPEPPQPAELARLEKIDSELRELLAHSGRYVPVSIAPVLRQAKAQALDTCPACAVSLARKVGAQAAVVGWVQKVSNLILNINVVVLAVPSGRTIAFGGVSIRGNTDLSWSRGLHSVVMDQLLAPGH